MYLFQDKSKYLFIHYGFHRPCSQPKSPHNVECSWPLTIILRQYEKMVSTAVLYCKMGLIDMVMVFVQNNWTKSDLHSSVGLSPADVMNNKRSAGLCVSELFFVQIANSNVWECCCRKRHRHSNTSYENLVSPICPVHPGYKELLHFDTTNSPLQIENTFHTGFAAN